MMNYIWVIIIIFSFFSAIATKNMSSLSTSVIAGGSDAITLIIKLCGVICFWNGIMGIAEKGGFTTILCKFFQPILKLLFPTIKDKKTKDEVDIPEVTDANHSMVISSMDELKSNEKPKEVEEATFIGIND